MDNNKPKLIAHRFGRCLGPDLALSTLNTLLANKSPMIGGVEIDCVLSRDKKLVLLHDNHLDETTTLSGWAHEYSASELQKSFIVHQGKVTDEHPMLLEELWPYLEKDPRQLIVQIETKAYQNSDLAVKTTDYIIKELQGSNLPKNITPEIISFWPASCERAAEEGLASRFISNALPLMNEACLWAKSHQIEGFILEHAYLTEEALKMVREHGLTWTSGNLVHQWQYDAVCKMPYAPLAICTDNPFELA